MSEILYTLFFNLSRRLRKCQKDWGMKRLEENKKYTSNLIFKIGGTVIIFFQKFLNYVLLFFFYMTF